MFVIVEWNGQEITYRDPGRMNPTFWEEARDGKGPVSNGCMCHFVLQYNAKITLVFHLKAIYNLFFFQIYT